MFSFLQEKTIRRAIAASAVFIDVFTVDEFIGETNGLPIEDKVISACLQERAVQTAKKVLHSGQRTSPVGLRTPFQLPT